jgi:hypothetical protein
VIMPIIPAKVAKDAFDVVHQTLSRRASAWAFSLPRLSKADPRTLSIAMPHRVEFLALGDLRRDTIPKKAEPDCWRFLVLQERASDTVDGGGDRPAIAAVTAVRPKANGFEFGGLNEGPFVEGTEKAIRQAEALIGDREGQFEAVLLVVPALYVVALWLQDLSSDAPSSHSSEADLLIPIAPSNPALDLDQPITPASFLKAVRRIGAHRRRV